MGERLVWSVIISPPVTKRLIMHRFHKQAKWLKEKSISTTENWTSEKEMGDFLYGLVLAVKPRTVLETGTYTGFTTHAIAQGLKYNGFGNIDTVDIKDWGILDDRLIRGGVQDYVTQYLDSSITWLCNNRHRRYDIIFCDDYHSDEYLSREINLLDDVLNGYGYIVFHDTFKTKTFDLGKVVKDWCKEKEYNYIELLTYHGAIIVQKGLL